MSLYNNNDYESIINSYLKKDTIENKEKIPVIKAQENCEHCNGTGRIYDIDKGRYIKCEMCEDVIIDTLEGVEIEIKNITVNKEDVEDYLRKNNAPLYIYDNFMFDIDEIRNDSMLTEDITESVEFNTYLRKLNSLNLQSLKGSPLKRSYLISSNRGLGKTYLQWSILKNYYMKGIKVSPAFLTEDLYKIKKNSESIHELIMNYDVIQINLSGSLEIKRNLLIFLEILEKCKFENKPLIVYTVIPTRALGKYYDILSLLKVKSKEGRFGDLTLIEYHKPFVKEEKTYNKYSNNSSLKEEVEDLKFGF